MGNALRFLCGVSGHCVDFPGGGVSLKTMRKWLFRSPAAFDRQAIPRRLSAAGYAAVPLLGRPVEC